MRNYQKRKKEGGGERIEKRSLLINVTVSLKNKEVF